MWWDLGAIRSVYGEIRRDKSQGYADELKQTEYKKE